MSRLTNSTLTSKWVSPIAEAAATGTSKSHQALWSSPGVFWSLVLAATGLALLVNWQMELNWQVGNTAAQIRQINHDELELSQYVEDARRARTHFIKYLEGAKRVIATGDEKGWTPLLRSIATDAGNHIFLQQVKVWEEPAGSGRYSVIMFGVASGVQPRSIADEFLRRFRSNLSREYKVLESVRFEELEGTVRSADPVRFHITTRIGKSASDRSIHP